MFPRRPSLFTPFFVLNISFFSTGIDEWNKSSHKIYLAFGMQNNQIIKFLKSVRKFKFRIQKLFPAHTLIQTKQLAN